MSAEYSYSARKARALKRGFEDEHGETAAGCLSGAFSRAIGRQESGDAYAREKFEVDQVSVQFLMGHDVSQALRLNSSAQRVKTSQENRRKGRDSRRSLELLRQLTEQLAVIERLIGELEEGIELLRSQARECREEALLLFEQADAMEDLLEGGLEEHERAEAIRLLRVSGCNDDLDLIDLEQLSVLLASQINSA